MLENNIVFSTLLLLLFINLIGFLYSYIIIKTDFFKDYKLQNRPHKIEDFRNRSPLICLNIGILMLITGLGLYYFPDFIIKDFNGLSILIFEIIVVLMIDDIYFYLWHRLMHENKFLYKKIHKIHHRATTPFPSEYLYVHPIEWMVGMIGPFIGIFLLEGVSLYSFWMILIIRNLHELDIHSGLKSSYLTKYFPFSGTNEHHDMHHAYLNGNYASAFSFWDKMFKTSITERDKFHN